MKGSKFADGSLHLASSFQVAGFTHVIASMWSTGDDVCVRVADLFHGELTRNGMRDVRNRDVAEALRKAVVQVSEEFGDVSKWAPFIHVGA